MNVAAWDWGEVFNYLSCGRYGEVIICEFWGVYEQNII
jgi:hypothetical protein